MQHFSFLDRIPGFNYNVNNAKFQPKIIKEIIYVIKS
jgi:hypothetical protein